MAPELIHPTLFGLETEVPSKEADIYALGMTVYQVLTGQWPFYPKGEEEIMYAVMLGERPPKPEDAEKIGMPEVVWELVMKCWRGDRTKRPVILEILKRFCDITGEGRTVDSTSEVTIPRLDIPGNRSLVISEHPSFTTYSCE